MFLKPRDSTSDGGQCQQECDSYCAISAVFTGSNCLLSLFLMAPDSSICTLCGKLAERDELDFQFNNK